MTAEGLGHRVFVVRALTDLLELEGRESAQGQELQRRLERAHADLRQRRSAVSLQ
jgi:hypothetical protein